MASYPSDAPLPRFKVTSVSGRRAAAGVLSVLELKFTAEMTNYQDVYNWFIANFGRSNGGEIPEDGNTVFVFSIHYLFEVGPHYSLLFGVNGLEPHSPYDIVLNTDYYDVGWNKLLFKSILVQGLGWITYEFSPYLFFCEIHIPNISDVPSDVWTDLQFKQTSVQPSSSGLAIIVPLVLVFLLILALGLGGRRHGRR